MPSPECSLVIPAYNEADALPATLAAARLALEAAGTSWELVVVDNNSSDATAALARAAGAAVVFEPVNNIARARNAGGRAATGRFLFFLDADTLLPPAVLREALAALRGGACSGGGAAVAFDGPVPLFARAFTALWNHLAPRLGYAAGSFVFCPKEAFDAVGGFNPKLYASEEIHFSKALARWGRPKGMAMRVGRAPVLTSARKTAWFSQPRLVATLLLLMCFPFLARSKRCCAVWYTRPK